MIIGAVEGAAAVAGFQHAAKEYNQYVKKKKEIQQQEHTRWTDPEYDPYDHRADSWEREY